MFSLLGIIFDAIVVVVFISTIMFYIKRGFMASLLNLLGTIGSIVIGVLLSGFLSPIIFETFFEQALLESVQTNVQNFGTSSIDEILQGVIGVFPQAFVDNVANTISGTVNSQAGNMAQGIVDNVAQSIFLPIINIVIFVIVFIICKIVASILEKTFGSTFNRIPIVGGLNRLLGGALGVVGGIINAVLVLFLFWFVISITGGNLPTFSHADLSASFFYKLFMQLNPLS